MDYLQIITELIERLKSNKDENEKELIKNSKTSKVQVLCLNEEEAKQYGDLGIVFTKLKASNDNLNLSPAVLIELLESSLYNVKVMSESITNLEGFVKDVTRAKEILNKLNTQ